MIVSCDLPGEANQDCFGVEDGFAEIDDCGVCAGGETGIELNADKDECGICNGPGSVYECGCSVCAQCGDESAINYNEEAINDDLCIYDLCTDYYTTNNSFECASNGSVPYTVGEDLTCETLETEFSMCYPECDNLIKLADFEDKIIFVIYEEDW